ncbi:penicillin-binding protein 2 [Pokkaliibacter sp. CJK22405]|uniref:penicillin-binding protein 2 n=1 Tax=Pokkaliibacter sp. CJK22405 TaxID=3384615 RepID=UPI003984C88A
MFGSSFRDQLTIRNHGQERRIFSSRAVIAWVLIMLMVLGLVARLLYLQVYQYERYITLSDQNRVQLVPVAPTRGLIYDTDGNLLADNRPNFSLTITKEKVDDMDKLLDRLGQIISLDQDDVQRFKRRLNLRRRPFESVPLKLSLDEREIAAISVNLYRLPGVQVEADLVRHYPYGAALAHALGYVGRINERELQKVDAENYSATHYIGKLGVERYYEDALHGEVGLQKVETNARGRILRVLERDTPIPGLDLTLYLNMKLQRAAEKALKGQRAALVALDPNTGGILALVSEPGYDPNEFVTGISFSRYKALQDDPNLPLFNRALTGRYPPASTVKPMMGIAANDSGTIGLNYTVFDPGYYQIGGKGRLYRDWKRWGHGLLNLRQAIAQSCDVFFYDVGHKMGIDTMSSWLHRFGYGQVGSLDLPEASRGILPSREWKQRLYKQPWYPGDTVNMSIGQGYLLATPMQLATSTAIIANHGKWLMPRMLKHFGTPEHPVTAQMDSRVAEYEKMAAEERAQLPGDIKLKDDGLWDYVIQGMKDVTSGPHGTARSLGKNSTYVIAGKTGTAQVVGIKQDERYDASKLSERNRDHHLFVGFAPADDPKIVVSIIVENGGGGGGSALIAKKVMDAYLLGKDPDDDNVELSNEPSD